MFLLSMQIQSKRGVGKAAYRLWIRYIDIWNEPFNKVDLYSIRLSAEEIIGIESLR